ncbi:leucine-rich repeat-containing protein 56 [Genypterus blacodes]|uniref:leucine-rich repeat-containing protein 56 n=1 Tax=Genypterus blacodes TaxID=154954 RepID=UPI003F758DAE
MSCCGSEPRQVRPVTARVLVTELSGSGPINPTPTIQRSAKLCLSPKTLESLCGTQDLSQVTSLELCVDTREDTLGNFGVYLPNLVQLKLNNSVLLSVRDVGNALSHLQVLWMSHCRLQELDGILSFSSLKELYVAYNSVSDLSHVGMLENLQVLDLEGNDVDDLVQVKYLGLCGKLQTLNLEGNPVCVCPNPAAGQTGLYSYRAAVRELIPQLRYLDNVRVEEDRPSCSSTMGEEWAVVLDSIRDNNYTQTEETADDARPYNRPSSARRLTSSPSLSSAFSSTGFRPLSGSRPRSARPGIFSPPGSGPGFTDSDPAAAETSILTHGAGNNLFCGNPVKAIRARREKLKTAPTTSTFTPCYLPIHVPEHSYDIEEPDTRERGDVFAELKAWREQNSRRLQAIEREKLPQVLVIQHSKEEEDEDDEGGVDEDEDETGLGVMKSDSSGEEHGDAKQVDAAWPGSSSQSLSPDPPHRDILAPELARLSLSPDTTPSPLPPLNAPATGNCRPPGIRARRLRLRQVNAEPSGGAISIERPLVAATARADTDELQRVQQVTKWPADPMTPRSTDASHQPTARTFSTKLTDQCVEDVSSLQPRTKHPTSKLLDRPSITRPRTASAALQKHHQHQKVQPHTGSSHPD